MALQFSHTELKEYAMHVLQSCFAPSEHGGRLAYCRALRETCNIHPASEVASAVYEAVRSAVPRDVHVVLPRQLGLAHARRLALCTLLCGGASLHMTFPAASYREARESRDELARMLEAAPFRAKVARYATPCGVGLLERNTSAFFTPTEHIGVGFHQRH